MRSRIALPAVTFAVLAAAVGATNAVSQAPQNTSQLMRSQTYLKVTQNELAGTGHQVETIALAAQTTETEVYLLSGATDQCLLIAGTDQPDGHSMQLACSRDAAKADGKPLATSISLRERPSARMDIAVLPSSATEISTFNQTDRSETPMLSTELGVAVSVQRNENAIATLTWTTEQGRSEHRFQPYSVPTFR